MGDAFIRSLQDLLQNTHILTTRFSSGPEEGPTTHGSSHNLEPRFLGISLSGLYYGVKTFSGLYVEKAGGFLTEGVVQETHIES